MMFPRLFLAALAALLPLGLAAQVPQLINYQGRVAVGGVNFSGGGQFKFALVNANGSQTYWSNDGTSANGSQPAAAVTLSVANGLYSVLLGDASIPNMSAVPASVFTNPDVRLRVWFNDGTNGSQLLTPDQRIAAVGYALMADGVRAGGVTSAMIANGAIGSAQIGVGAITGSNIANGTIGSAQIASGAVGSGQLATGAVQSSNLATGAAAANLAASGQSGVPAGGVILSPTESPALIAAGYIRIGTTVVGDNWQPRAGFLSTASQASARSAHTAVWTGTEMIVWGGLIAGTINPNNPTSSARYNPATNTWATVRASGAPSARTLHTAVWTGSEMIIFGGRSGSTALNDGGRYNPVTDGWFSLPVSSPGSPPIVPAVFGPSARHSHTAVWTGTEMLVWGGLTSSNTPLGDGVRFSSTANAWTALATASAPPARGQHTAVWTGSEMIIWGGYDGSACRNDGARYALASGTWTALPTASARAQHIAVWSGTEMIVWGGRNLAGYLGDGERYSPASNAWTALPAAGSPSPRLLHTAVWSGTEMIVWGGLSGSSAPLGDGARYSPAGDAWTTLPTANAPSARSAHTAVWTGSEMLVWGGLSASNTALSDGSRYHAANNAWTRFSPTDGPSARSQHTAVWTGAEMIIWGGYNGSTFYQDGAPLASGMRYNPAANAWTTLPIAGAPPPRYQHTAVWTGSEMIVWGGRNLGGYLNDGARYSVSANSWTALATAGAPPARGQHTAVWTGDEMIVFGGFNGAALADGARYNLGADAWTALPTAGAPSARALHTAVWTGSEMIVFGGTLNSENNSPSLNDGARYSLSANAWTALPTAGAPGTRFQHTAVWTGSEMIVWGGARGINTPVGDGARYFPAANAWTTLPTASAPTPRYFHTAVWTGSEMIVWGGAGASSNDAGARYNPATDAWTGLPVTSAPTARAQHTAVWTGSEMIVFGGYGSAISLGDTYSYTPGRLMYLYQRP